MKLVFLAGLPRSGSTILANLLAQNPDVLATPTSGLVGIIKAIQEVCDQNNIWKSMEPEEKNRHKLDMIRGVVEARFNGHGKICLDKNRAWPEMFELMANALGKENLRALICVRDLRDVLASFEKLYRKTMGTSSTPQKRSDSIAMLTALSRAQTMMKMEQPVGYALAVTRDAITRGWRQNMLFVDYDSLCGAPDRVLESIYKFIDEPFFEHDFDNVEQVTRERDEFHGFVGLHTIRKELKPQPTQWPTVFDEAVTESQFWENLKTYSHFWWETSK